MPSTAILEKKQAQVAALAERIKGSIAGVVVDYKGITVEDDTKLRKELREAGVEYTVVKNTLLKRAADDYVASARILQKFADNHKNFTLKSGYLDGAVISTEKLQSLAKLPSREVLLATVCSVFSAPIAAFARGVKAIVDKGGVEECLKAKTAEAPSEEAPATETAE